MFVDNSGRRAKLLRRFGTFVGVVCLGYAALLGMAFMGWGMSLTPSSLLPFAGGGPGGPGPEPGPGGAQPQGATGTPPVKPYGTPPTGIATDEPPARRPDRVRLRGRQLTGTQPPHDYDDHLARPQARPLESSGPQARPRCCRNRAPSSPCCSARAGQRDAARRLSALGGR